MTDFLVFGIAALLMIAIALAILLPAFWGYYRLSSASFSGQNIQVAKDRLAELKQQRHYNEITEKEYRHQRDELEQSLALELDDNSRKITEISPDKRAIHVLLLAFFISMLSLILYFSLGTPEIFLQSTQQVAQQLPAEHDMDNLIAGLERRLESDPHDLEGWMMLGRSYMSLKQYEKAIRVFNKAEALFGEEPPLLLAHADALSMAHGGRLSGKPYQLVKKALAKEPDNAIGLWLSGLAEQEQGNHQQAISYWQRARQQLSDDPASQKEIATLIDQAQNSINPGSKQIKTLQAPLTGIHVTVQLDNSLKDKVNQEDTVLVYAQAMQGMRMPLAIVKKKVVDLPFDVLLNDETAMMPAMKLSGFEKVNVTARISRSGQATPQKGDLLGSIASVKTKSRKKIEININQIYQ